MKKSKMIDSVAMTNKIIEDVQQAVERQMENSIAKAVQAGAEEVFREWMKEESSVVMDASGEDIHFMVFLDPEWMSETPLESLVDATIYSYRTEMAAGEDVSGELDRLIQRFRWAADQMERFKDEKTKGNKTQPNYSH